MNGFSVSDLQVEECGSTPHGLAYLQAVEELGEARRALVVRGQHFNVHSGDGAPEEHRHMKKKQLQTLHSGHDWIFFFVLSFDTLKCSSWEFPSLIAAIKIRHDIH